MRLALTVVAPVARAQADVVLDADPATPVAEVAEQLAYLMNPGQGFAGSTELAGASAGAHILQFPGPRPREGTGLGRHGRDSSGAGYNEAAHGHGKARYREAGYGGDGGYAAGYGVGGDYGAGHAMALATGSAPGHAGPPVYVNYRRVDPELALADSEIKDGCVVSLGDASGCLRPEPAGILEIRVVGGPAAGTVHRLTLGEAGIGSGDGAHIRIADAGLPGLALHVSIDVRGGCQVTPFDGVAVTLDREPLTGPAMWLPGQQIAVGNTLLGLAPYEPPDAALHPSEDGAGLDFNRPPRLLPPERMTRFQLPSPPGRAERRPLPILMAVVPVILGVAMAYFLHEIYMLAMSLMSPVMLIGNHYNERKHGRKTAAQQAADYSEHKARIERDAQEALDAERVQRRDDCPDPATVLTIASGPRRRLWERRRTDPDYLLLRVGTADLPSAVELTDPTQDEHRRRVFWTVPDAPVAIPLSERGVLGVAGPGDAPRAIGRWLVAQAATLHSPNDLQIYLLTDSSGQASWEWVRWLPHARPPEGQNTAALIGNDAETVAARIAELLATVNARQKALRESGQETARFQQADIVVVFDGSRKLRSLPGAIQVLKEGPQVGVYAICLDAEERLLPAECHAVAAVEPDGIRVQQMSELTVRQVRPDHVAPGWCARLARAMAPVRDVSDDDDAAGLPDSSRLLDVLRLEPPTAEAVAARWNANGRSTLAMLGDSYDGPFGIDLKKDGPHGLIAGTTGSGKSELLQTIVASLAVANRPDAMTFVLVDYKGGSAFKDCVQLPHTVGMVTDLDAHLVERALVSLSAELTRREHILAGVGAKDIEDYTSLLDRGGHGLEPVPRLLIVIDEFASMVRDLPDFVTGLVNIAQRGRSLGIHLILATQRPSGVVSGDIRANTNLRIALRVTDVTESQDVIDAKDAGYISKSTPGRAYVRLGHSSLVPFQAGRVGGRRPGAALPAGAHPWLARLGWTDLGRPEPQRPAAQQREEEEITDLKVLVEAIQRASDRLRVPAQHSPWLPALPETLLLSDLADAAVSGSAELAAIPYGVDDLPALQEQHTAAISPATFGHLMAAGAPRSGRSQLLRTIAGSIAATHSCADAHIYGIDCGNGALLPVADLPHCGAVVTRTQTERAARLIGRLGAEVSRRADLLAESGFADLTEQRAVAVVGERLPHIFILLDRWEGFTTTLGETGNGALTDTIMKILSEGASVGVHLIMTGDRSLVAGRMGAMTEEKLAFKLAEKDDYSMIGLRPRDMPDNVPPGRAFRSGSGLETQVALLAPDTSGQGQAAALRSIGEAAARRDASVPGSLRPFRVDVLPGRITFRDAWKLRDQAAAASPLWGLVGVGGDELIAYGPDLADGVPAFIVGGPSKSGRSTILFSMALSFLASETQLIIVTPRPSQLRSLAGAPGVLRVFDSPALDEEEFASAVASFTGPGVVVMDDAEMHRDCDAGGELSKLISFGADARRGLVLGGDSESIGVGFGGWQVDAKRARRGCLTAPQSLPEGDLIGVRLTHSQIGDPVRPGRALLNVGDGNLVTVTVPID
jgi:S-DNA-T family DNA segregation ATPase FtsK/SpoIIIE